MQLYSHSLLIRIWHPNVEPSLISKALGMESGRSWRAGDPRTTPRGTPLQGRNAESYWSADPFAYGWRPSTDSTLEDALSELIKALRLHKEFLQNLVSGGGRVLVHASSQGRRNYAVELSPALLGQLAELGVSLAHDVYSVPQGA
jgi:hypothetical protein